MPTNRQITIFFPVWRYHTISDSNPPIVLKTSFGAKPPNLMITNISSYMVCTIHVVGLATNK